MKGVLSVCIVLGAAVSLVAIAGVAGASSPVRPGLEGTVWVANRAIPRLVAYDAATGDLRYSVTLNALASDVAVGKDKVYVGEEAANAIAVIEGRSGEIVGRIGTGARPHHLAASSGGTYVAYSLFGTNKVGVIDARTDEVVGEWNASASPLARTHAAAFSNDGKTLYAANDVTNELTAVDARTGELLFSIPVPQAHELVVTSNERIAYVSRRSANAVRVIDLESRETIADIPVALPDTLQLSADGKQLTVGLRTTPARVAVIDTEALVATMTFELPGTLAGHQWTSPNGRWTFAAFEGAVPGTAVIDHRSLSISDVLPYPGGGRPHGLDYAGPRSG